MKLCLGLLLLLTGCSNAEFSKIEERPAQPLEEMVSKGLEIFAKSSSQCKNEKLAVVQQHKPMIQNVVAQIKGIVTNSSPTLNIKALRTYTNQSEGDQFDMLFQILTSDGFKTVVAQTSDVVKLIANNDTITTNLTAIRDDLIAEPGDRIAEIISSLASDTNKQSVLLGAMRSAMCNNPSEHDLLGALLTPKVLWLLGPNGTYLLGSSLMKHAKPLVLAIRQIPIPDELSQFVALVSDMAPKPDICAIESLDAYQKHLTLVLSLLAPADSTNNPRPLRNLVNVLFKLYSMEDSNQCTGTSSDDLKKETVQTGLLTIGNFLADEQHGVVGFLKQIKPRI